MTGITSIRLRDFRRYEDETVVFRSGLNFLEGQNNAGKTSVLYAVEYALFGRVGTLQPAALMRPKSRTVGVELCFVGRDGRHYRLQRIHVRPPRSKTTVIGHFTLKVREPDEEAEHYLLSSDFDDLETDLAVAVQSALGFTRRAWDLAVHHRQGAIADILNGSTELDIVLGVTSAVFVEEELRSMALDREKAANELPAVEARIAMADAERAERAVRRAELQADLDAARSRAAEVEARRAALAARQQALDALVGLVDAWTNAQSQLREADADHRRATDARDALGELAALQRARAEASDRVPALDAGRADARRAIAEFNARARELAGSRGDLQGRLERRQGLTSGGVCDHCGQDVDPAHLAAEIPALTEQLSALARAIRAVDDQTSEAQARQDAADEALSAGRIALAEAEAAVERHARAQQAVDRAEQARAQAGVALDAARLRAQTAVNGVDADGLAAHAQAVRDALTADTARVDADREHAEELVDRVQDELSDVDAAIARSERDAAEARGAADRLRADAEVARRLRVLAKGFKDVQRDLREGASAVMGERAFAIHKHLSGDDSELTGLEIDPRNYAVLVTPKDVGAQVPAALYQGGGHRLLLGLAVKLALAEQIGPVPFVLLDEPTYGLDGARKLALLERISELKVSDQLVLITHAELGPATGHRQRVVRDGTRSTIQPVEGSP